MFKTTHGLILREVKYKESDRILTVLTEDMGRITVTARGALKKGSKTSAATRSLVLSELTMSEFNGRWQVSEGSTMEEFRGLRSDISVLALASYFAECVEAVSGENCPEPLMLQLILNCLFALSNGIYDQRQIKTAFEMRLMCILGYTPDLQSCAVCGNTEIIEPMFSPKNGIVCCRECRKTGLEATTGLCTDSLKALRYITEAEPKRILAYKLADKPADRAANAAEVYLLTQTGRTYSTLNYWKQVK